MKAGIQSWRKALHQRSSTIAGCLKANLQASDSITAYHQVGKAPPWNMPLRWHDAEDMVSQSMRPDFNFYSHRSSVKMMNRCSAHGERGAVAGDRWSARSLQIRIWNSCKSESNVSFRITKVKSLSSTDGNIVYKPEYYWRVPGDAEKEFSFLTAMKNTEVKQQNYLCCQVSGKAFVLPLMSYLLPIRVLYRIKSVPLLSKPDSIRSYAFRVCGLSIAPGKTARMKSAPEDSDFQSQMMVEIRCLYKRDYFCWRQFK
jgi:hypothetical protein